MLCTSASDCVRRFASPRDSFASPSAERSGRRLMTTSTSVMPGSSASCEIRQTAGRGETASATASGAASTDAASTTTSEDRDAASDAALAGGRGAGAPPPTVSDVATTPMRAAAPPAKAIAARARGDMAFQRPTARVCSPNVTELDVDAASGVSISGGELSAGSVTTARSPSPAGGAPTLGDFGSVSSTNAGQWPLAVDARANKHALSDSKIVIALTPQIVVTWQRKRGRAELDGRAHQANPAPRP